MSSIIIGLLAVNLIDFFFVFFVKFIVEEARVAGTNREMKAVWPTALCERIDDLPALFRTFVWTGTIKGLSPISRLQYGASKEYDPHRASYELAFVSTSHYRVDLHASRRGLLATSRYGCD
jgi:hypothetical protein